MLRIDDFFYDFSNHTKKPHFITVLFIFYAYQLFVRKFGNSKK